MPRRPNFNFERQQRDRAKAAKREAKREARAARKAAAANAPGHTARRNAPAPSTSGPATTIPIPTTSSEQGPAAG